MTSQLIRSIFASLPKRGVSGRTEADIQSDIKVLLLAGGFDLSDEHLEVHLEAQTGAQQRIDVEVGFTVIEVKRDLRSETVRIAAIEQLRGYVEQRTALTRARYVGILTDGHDWILYTLLDGQLVEASRLSMRSAEDGAALLSWLSTVLATTQSVKATANEIDRRFGASSPAHNLDLLSLKALWDSNQDNGELQLKKELWGKLLHTALGDNFNDEISLFIQHTYLVIIAELIAHEVLGIDVISLDSLNLVTGSTFTSAGVLGVVESDFFDWPAELPGGDRIVKAIARRVAQIDWATTEHDLLKHLYESVINAEQRKSLGEYYTPDWLAEAVVAEVVDDPGNQRVLDPACGSGTFLFHSVRRALHELEEAGMRNDEALARVTNLVYGMDVHPVAVTLARVTYLLALGTHRLSGQRDTITIPVYLGDSVQWGNVSSLLNDDGLTVPTNDGHDLFSADLFFPQSVLDNPLHFDQLIDGMVHKATDRRRGQRPFPSVKGLLRDYTLSDHDIKSLETTFRLMCDLHDQHRNHIWGYYVKNLSRPLWLTRESGKVHRIVGNPPWLSYRFMDPSMQVNFKKRSESRNLWIGNNVATQQDLSTFFLVRTAELYLENGGLFGVVLPRATLNRKATQGFRTGKWGAAGTAQFVEGWDLEKITPPLFPVPSCVVSGTYRTAEASTLATAMPSVIENWSGKVPTGSTWKEAQLAISRVASTSNDREYTGSLYGQKFRNGATIFPRVLFMVQQAAVTNLGMSQGKIQVMSARSSQEKGVWAALPSRSATPVEAQFVFDVHLGSTLLPFRMIKPQSAVLPYSLTKGMMFDPASAEGDAFPLLKKWWGVNEADWVQSGSGKMSLLEQLNYMGKFESQFPIANIRLAYTKAGTRLAAAVVEDPNAVIDHKLYWASIKSKEEGLYLCAILNSQTAQTWVEPLQSRGNMGARDFDKYVWELPIAIFDNENDLHGRLAELGKLAEVAAESVEIPEGVGFQKARKLVRNELENSGIQDQIEVAVQALFESNNS